MFNRPQWRADLVVESIDSDTVVVLDEQDCAVLTGSTYTQISPLLDGTRTLDDLLRERASKTTLPEILYALTVLSGKGYLVEGGNGMPRHMAALWNSLHVDTVTAGQRLQGATVSVHSLGGVAEAQLTESLRAAGIEVAETGVFDIVAVDDYLESSIGPFNKRALAERRPWMLVKPIGNILWIGPFFVPRQTACWECLAQRLRSNRQMEAFLYSLDRDRAPMKTSLASHPIYSAAAFNLVAAEAMKIAVSGRSRALESTVVTLDVRTLEMQHHAVTRRPQCLACGNHAYRNRSAVPIALASSKKTYRDDGGHRTRRPEETYNKLSKHVSPITGAITTLTNLTGEQGAGLTYSYSAGHNFALFGKDLMFLVNNLRGRSGGKGVSEMQAKVSAMCEAIERYSGLYRGDEIERLAAYEEFRPGEAIAPNELMLFSEEQYRSRQEWNRREQSAYHKVPEPFDSKRKIHWTPAWSLTQQRFAHVPSAYCYYGHSDLSKFFLCSCDANGCAAGNTLEEAILQGFFELIERDSVALWWYNRVRRPAVDLASFNDPYFGRLQDFYRSINREIWALDLTAEHGIPCFAAVSRRTDCEAEDIVLGFGAHFNAHLALLRALTEVNQFLPSVSQRDANGNTIYWFHDAEAIQWWKTATVQTDGYVLPAPDAAARRSSDYKDLSSDDLKTDVERCATLVAGMGLNMLVLDQSQADIDLRVAKVMIPGLRHFWKRFGPGRLYDQPVKMNWLDRPQREADLNPVGIFF